MSNANCIWLKTIGKRQPFLHSLPCGAEPVILNGINWLSAVSLAAAIAPKVVEPVCSDNSGGSSKSVEAAGEGTLKKCRLISEGLRVRERFGDGVLVCVCSHIEKSSENLERLLRAVNNTLEVLRESLICFITITVNRCGPLGKLQTIRAITQRYLVPSAIIDDNEQVIGELETCIRERLANHRRRQ